MLASEKLLEILFFCSFCCSFVVVGVVSCICLMGPTAFRNASLLHVGLVSLDCENYWLDCTEYDHDAMSS